jgi:FkbM family methyltransferase
MSWLGLELVIRSGSVDRNELEWMATSPFWKAFEKAAVSPDDLVFDLGAHIGSFAILVAKHKDCRVIAFEPDLESLNLCKINVLMNGLENQVTCHPLAVGGETRKILLYEATENWAHTIVKSGGPFNVPTGRTTEVDCLSLSDAFDRGERLMPVRPVTQSVVAAGTAAYRTKSEHPFALGDPP